MKFFEGKESPYCQRHNELWPEVRNLLKSATVINYSIFLDQLSYDLIAVMEVESEEKLSEPRKYPLMRKWRNYMKDIMESNNDGSPVTIPLNEVFHLS